MIPGFKEVLRQTEEFVLVLRSRGLVVEKATWILPEDAVEWKLVLVIPAIAQDRRIIYLCIIEVFEICNDLEFNVDDIKVEATDKRQSLPYRIVKTI